MEVEVEEWTSGLYKWCGGAGASLMSIFFARKKILRLRFELFHFLARKIRHMYGRPHSGKGMIPRE